MSELKITGITVSLDIKSAEYGTGSSNYISLKAETTKREGDAPSEGVSLEEALDMSLDMHLKAFESILSARVGGSTITGGDYKVAIDSARRRFQVARKHLGLTKGEE